MRKIKRPSCPNSKPLERKSNYKDAENKSALLEASFYKCMYCESSLIHVSFGDVEHIKPKAKFPDLEFSWENLGIVCSKCNNTKSDSFDETTPYINPYDEDPEEHIISIGAYLSHKNGSVRGELTIHDIELNRPALLEKRFERIMLIQKFIDNCSRHPNAKLKESALNELLKEAEANKEYSLCIKALFKAHDLI